MGWALLVSLVVFLASAAALSWLCLALAPVAMVLLVLYSYGKRFTDFPQALLALAQFVAPVGAWIAVTGHVGWAAAALGIAVGTWIGGFDLIYSCQDAEIDRQIGSRSFPARFGIAGGAAHVVGGARGDARRVRLVRRRGRTGLAVVDGRRAHRGRPGLRTLIVRPDDLSRVNRAFFTANGVIGIGLFAFALADLIVHGLWRMSRPLVTRRQIRGGRKVGPSRCRTLGWSGFRARRARRTRALC